MKRARIFIETYDEMVIPFLFLLVTKFKKTNQKILILFGFLLIVTPSLLSNFRSRILMLLFAFFVSFILLLGKRVLIRVSFLASFVAVAFIATIFLKSIFGFSFIDRLTFQHQREDVGAMLVRVENFKKATEMGLAFPLFGAGLGNYYDYLPFRNLSGQSRFIWVNREAEISSSNPHNIFAQVLSETGILSLLFYIAMLGYFAKVDFQKIFNSRNDQYTKAYIISFWTLFLYALFNPTTTLPYNSFFWVLRGMI